MKLRESETIRKSWTQTDSKGRKTVWEWDETPDTRKAIKRLQMDIDERIRQLEKEAPDYGVGK